MNDDKIRAERVRLLSKKLETLSGRIGSIFALDVTERYEAKQTIADTIATLRAMNSALRAHDDEMSRLTSIDALKAE